MSGLVILAVFAHPDDETVCSGTLVLNARRGGRSVVLCATRGEVGEIRDPTLATPETLGQVRERELQEACAILGIDPPRFLDYRDSGMAGTPENAHPAALVNADRAHVLRQLVAAIRELRPEVVITFEPGGLYGHPDHIAISQFTTEAFTRAGQADQFPDAGAPWQPARLYYCTFEQERFRQFQQRLRQPGEEAPLPTIGTPAAAITTRVPIDEVLALKRQAMLAHRTQVDPEGAMARAQSEELRELFRFEMFIRVVPPLQPGEQDEFFSDPDGR
ncbi:MAG: PIG-L family deacetylase [Chloroflexi bacterium]|nr:PIG-L family deacetylase [Chloroflexota bacterium]GIW10077.1 MAG: GlcNAc-PI de-N-acetylase [Dehalococcoidia bacterium]